MAKWLLCDLHIHTTWSDGDVSLEQVAELYGRAGFDAIAITDHLFDTQSSRSAEIYEEGKSVQEVDQYFKAIDEVSLWAVKTYGLLVLPGLEICNLIEDYHLLGIDLKKSINPNQNADGVIKQIHQQGGLAIASHPPLKLSYFINGDFESIHRHPLHLWTYRERYADQIDAWEIGNGEDLFAGIGLEKFPYVANSDFHKPHHIHSWKSMIFAEKDKESIKQAIRGKQVAIFFFGDKGKQRKLFFNFSPKGVDDQEVNMNSPEKGKILIVDDEKDLVDMLAYHFERRGYKIIKAYDGYEAWQKIESDPPDLLILDLMMPNLDGWELCRLIRRAQERSVKEIGILMLTARALPEDKVYGLEIGADDYLVKPFSLNELILRVEKLMTKKQSVTQLREEMATLQSSIESREMNLKQVAHDLKSPLLSIGFSAKRMLRKEQREDASKALKEIFDNSFHLTQWIDETLLRHNLSESNWQDGRTEVEVRTLIQHAIDLLKEMAKAKKIEVTFNTTPPHLPISLHKPLMNRALVNLLSNAFKYTPYGGKVSISLYHYLNKRGTGVAEITIQDNGPGIPEEDLEKIFDLYYRGKNVSPEDGKGIGLAFVKHIIQLHGGKILVQSEVNKGSLFSVLLPIHQISPRDAQSSHPTSPLLNH